MKDYYTVLGLKPDCGKAEIRRAYRIRAKELHPDRSGSRGSTRFLAIKEAYEVLISPSTREAYNKTRKAFRTDSSDWNYREFLQSRKDDPKSLSQLICYDLLHDLDVEAVDLYDQAQSGGYFSLLEHLDSEDFMDYGFLLAEAYLEQGAVVKAYRLLRGIAALEEKDPYFKHFYVDVLEKLAAIVHQSLPDDEEDWLRRAFLVDLVKLSYPPREEARLRKLLSELLSAAGNHRAAARELFHAYKLAPGLPGLAETVQAVRELSKELGGITPED